MVQVVSILEVPKMLMSVSFQSNDVSGAQYSELLFCSVTGKCFTMNNVDDSKTKLLFACTHLHLQFSNKCNKKDQNSYVGKNNDNNYSNSSAW